MIARGRVLVAGVAAAVGAALLAAAADQAVAPDATPAASSPAKAAGGPAPSGPHAAAAGAHAAPAAPKRPRVPAGVLVRAASRRAQEREAANPPVPERRRARQEGEVLSVDIDWHAGTSAER